MIHQKTPLFCLFGETFNCHGKSLLSFVRDERLFWFSNRTVAQILVPPADSFSLYIVSLCNQRYLMKFCAFCSVLFFLPQQYNRVATTSKQFPLFVLNYYTFLQAQYKRLSFKCFTFRLGNMFHIRLEQEPNNFLHQFERKKKEDGKRGEVC